MKGLIFLVFIALFTLCYLYTPPVNAISTPNVTFIPETFYLSANSSFLMVVDTGGFQSARVTWMVPEAEAQKPGTGFGSFPQVGNKFICYFTCVPSVVPCNIDPETLPENTCGPTPFKQALNYPNILIQSVNRFGLVENNTIEQSFTDVILDYNIIGPDANGTVFMRVQTSKPTPPENVSYQFLHKDTLEIVEVDNDNIQGDLELNPGYAIFTGNATLPPGEYYVVFRAKNPPYGLGGAVSLVSVPDLEPSCDDGIQNGQETGVDCGGPECPACSIEPGPSDEYEIVADAMDPIPEIWVREGHDLSLSYPDFTIRSISNNTLNNLSVRVSANFSSILDVDLDDASLAPGGIMFYSVRLINVQNGMDIYTNVDVLSLTDKIGEIPIRIRVSLLSDTCDGGVVVQEGDLAMTPSSWQADVAAGDTITKTFTLTNNGEDTITNLTFISNIPGLTYTFPPSIGPGESSNAILSFSRETPGRYCCSFTISSPEGSQTGIVVLDVYANVSGSINSLTGRVSSLRTQLQAILSPSQFQQVESILSDDIEPELNSAQFDFSQGNFESAERRILEVENKVDLLESVYSLLTDIPVNGNGGGNGSGGLEIDMTMVMIIVAVIAIIGVAFYWFRMRKPKYDGGEEEALDEEFEYKEESPEKEEE